MAFPPVLFLDGLIQLTTCRSPCFSRQGGWGRLIARPETVLHHVAHHEAQPHQRERPAAERQGIKTGSAWPGPYEQRPQVGWPRGSDQVLRPSRVRAVDHAYVARRPLLVSCPFDRVVAVPPRGRRVVEK